MYCIHRYTLAESGMAVMELEMLTAHKPDLKHLVYDHSSIGLRKAEYNDKRVALYFDEVKVALVWSVLFLESYYI